MTSLEIYSELFTYSGKKSTIICDLHSACSPKKRRVYMCSPKGSHTPVVDFDEIKTLVDKAKGIPARKSVDAVAVSPLCGYLCFIELKSWDLLISKNGTEENIRKQADKYSSDLPQKLTDSIQICKEVTKDQNAFNDCAIIYVLLTDISVVNDGIMAFNSDLAALAGISSNLKKSCNSLSQGIMDSITNVETRYWECRNFDNQVATI